ncbi:MAG TPA: Gfo/Idh/MocA family oxidoreductase [Roseiflexaceae bacterium]|nr:Gfo/Idh/MocA family oxidoreductase [Roseiflexaceae bacterium]
MTLGIGLVGYGGIGRVHALCVRMLPLVYPDLPPVRIVAVQTASAASAERARRELGDVLATTRLEELLAHPLVAIVDCCAPTGDHGPIAHAALAAGHALFWEKPLAPTPEQSAEIVAEAERRGVAGGINFHFRQIPALQEARRLIENGLLGNVIGFHLRYYRASNLKRDRALTWRFSGPGSGVLADLGSHMIDMTHFLLGPIARVAAQTRIVVAERPDAHGATAAVEGDDVAWLQVQLENGGIGSIEASKMVPGAGDDIRIEAYGTAGGLIFDTRDPNGLEIAEGTASQGYRRIATLSRTQPAASLPSPETPTGVLAWHLASLRAFLESYTGTPPPGTPLLRDGLAVDRVIAAARASAADHAAWVDVQL